MYYADPGAAGSQNFTAPIDVQAIPSDGLSFKTGYQGRRQSFILANLTGGPASVTLSRLNGSIPMYLVRNPGINETLTELPTTIQLSAFPGAASVVIQVSAADHPEASQSLLEIRSDATTGTRWLAPVAVEPGSLDGLWVGEVVLNEVSEGRLGSTNSTYDVTVALAQQNASMTRGSAQMHEVALTGGGTKVQVAVSLSLPAVTPATMQTITGTPGQYVGGYVFLDENQNGQRDADEPGLSGITVTLQGAGTQPTAADGSYTFSSLAPAAGGTTYSISAPAPVGYTDQFKVTLPHGTVVVNSVPTSVTLKGDGISAVAPAAYLTQVLPKDYSLPYRDVNGDRVEPQINFGYAVAHTVKLRPGTCGSPGTGETLLTTPDAAVFDGTVNGAMAAEIPSATVAGLLNTKNHIVVERLSKVVACGDIVKASPTKFAHGGGSEFRFRLLLRVTGGGTAELLPHYAFTNTVGGPAFPGSAARHSQSAIPLTPPSRSPQATR